METLHRLAGVQDVSELESAQPAHLVSSHEPHAREASVTHDHDGETTTGSHSNRASRASLPLNRQPSRKSLLDNRSATNDAALTPRLHKSNSSQRPRRNSSESRRPETDAATADGDEDDENFAWGPTHPCFPHPNCYCLSSSPEYAATRVIRVRRDWLAAGDLYPQYANLYPEILDPLVSDADFRALIARINTITRRAFAPDTLRAWIDGVLGVLTGYLWEDVGLTGAASGARELERFLDGWNAERRAEGKDVRVVQLRTTGFMNLDFIIPDPGIDAVEPPAPEEGVGIGPAE